MKNFKKLLLNPWIIGVFTPIIALALAAVIKKINIIEASKWLFSTILNFTIDILTFKISIYVIVLISLGIFIAVKIYFKIDEVKEVNKSKWLAYTKNHYEKWNLTWQYDLQYDNKYQINNIRPICKCGCELIMKNKLGNISYGSGILFCPKCKNTYPLLDEDTLKDFRYILEYDIKNGQCPDNNIR